MADNTTPAKHEGGTKDAAGTSDNALAKLVGTKPIPPSEMGKSPQEKRGSVNSYVEYGPVPDPEAMPVAPEAQGAIGYAGASQAAYNEEYEDGAGIYAPKPRGKD